MATTKKTLYEILGIARDAMDLDIGMAYQQRLAEIEKGAAADAGALALLHEARDVLTNPKRRAAYDASLVTAAEKAAAAQQAAAPDLLVEADADEEEAPARSKRLIPLAGAGVAIALAIFIVAKWAGRPAEAPAKASEPVAEAPKPAPPPAPPKPLGAHQILPAALNAVGQVMSYEMSGAAVPISLGVAVEPNTMLTTCHGIPAGAQLVVRMGKEYLSANIAVDDEELDLCKLNVAGLNVKPIAIAAEEAKAGDKVFALGANAKGEFALTEGTVKQVWMAKSVKALELSMPIAPSASGGAVFDVYGRLAGIATTPHHLGAGIQAAISSGWIAQMRSRARSAPQ